MAWVRLDDGFVDHPKIARVGPIGAWIQVQALCYCNKNLTDGFIPFGIARSFAARNQRVDDRQRIWEAGEHCGMQGLDMGDVDWPTLLCEAGMWAPVDGGYVVHDFKDYQPSKADVLKERARWLERKRRSRVESRRSHAVNHAAPVPVPVPVPGEDLKDFVLVATTPDARPDKPGRAKPQTGWPENFALTPARIANAQRVGADAAWEWDKFRDYHRAKGSRFVDWDAAWRTWLRNAVDFDLRRAP